MERLDNDTFRPIMHWALSEGHVPIVAYFIYQGVPFGMTQVELVIDLGLHSLL